jgi:RNA polymerase sigma-70 factor, ECF subfamily
VLQPAKPNTDPGTRAGLSFERFFEVEYPRLARALLLLTGDPLEAEDLAQEAFARAFERWARVGALESPVGYVFRTSLNLHRKRLRHLRVRARHVLRVRASRGGAEDPAGVVESRLEVQRALAALSREQREALILVEWLGLDAQEAGAVLGIEAVSVRGRLHRAREALLERYGGVE